MFQVNATSSEASVSHLSTLQSDLALKSKEIEALQRDLGVERKLVGHHLEGVNLEGVEE